MNLANKISIRPKFFCRIWICFTSSRAEFFFFFWQSSSSFCYSEGPWTCCGLFSFECGPGINFTRTKRLLYYQRMKITSSWNRVHTKKTVLHSLRVEEKKATIGLAWQFHSDLKFRRKISREDRWPHHHRPCGRKKWLVRTTFPGFLSTFDVQMTTFFSDGGRRKSLRQVGKSYFSVSFDSIKLQFDIKQWRIRRINYISLPTTEYMSVITSRNEKLLHRCEHALHAFPSLPLSTFTRRIRWVLRKALLLFPS